MQQWRGLDDVPAGWGRCVVTIGSFDGVHRGHRELLRCTLDRARAEGLPTVVLAVDPEPGSVARQGARPAMLTTPGHRAELLEALGVDVLCVLPPVWSSATPDATGFAGAVLVERLHAAAVVVGADDRYGPENPWDAAGLRADAARFGLAVEEVPLLVDGEAPLSSSSVRDSLAAGDVDAAARTLGRAYRLEGPVVRGDQRGRQLGFPTANVAPVESSAVPADGTYAGWLLRWARPATGTVTRLPAAISIGTNPTFAGTERRIEVHVLDIEGGRPPHLELYGEHVGVEFSARLRDTVRFSSVDDLLRQLELDVRRSRELLAALPR